MDLGLGCTRADFAALGSFRGDAQGLYSVTRGRDFDIELCEWIAAASPHPDNDPRDQIEGWASAMLMCSRWAGSVRRHHASADDLERAGVGPILEAVRARIRALATAWRWPTTREIASLESDRLEDTYALYMAADSFRMPRRDVFDDIGIEVEARGAGEIDSEWELALRVELRARGQLPHRYVEVSEYDGAERASLSPTQLGADSVGRLYSQSRKSKIVSEWCDFFESSTTPIRYLSIDSRVPKRLAASLRGQSQLRGLRLSWGDYDDLSFVAAMPDLWNADFGGAVSVTDLGPLRSARALRVLQLGLSQKVADHSPLADLATLEEFTLGPSGFSDGKYSVPTIAFVRGMTRLCRMDLGAGVDDGDYSPLLDLAGLERARIVQQSAMHPSYDELIRQIPALSAR